MALLVGVDETALAFDRAVRSARVDYAFIGAFAVMAWGEPRATTDVDVLLSYSEAEAGRLSAALRSEGLEVDERDLVDALHDGGHISVFHGGSVFWLDVKPARTTVELEEVTEATEVAIRGQRLRIVRPEETIAFKLAFGSPKDIQDARSILIRQRGALDEERLDRFAAKLGVVSGLTRLRAEVSP